MQTNRTDSSWRNTSTAMFARVFSIVVSFLARTFFIRLLNSDYLGVNGLFTDILTLLSLAEMGIGTAIMYMMYKPIFENDIDKVSAYVQLYRKAYNVIGCTVIFLGAMVAPFLESLIKDIPDIDENIRVIYLLFLTNTAVSYFFTYKRTLLTVYQKEYLNSRNEMLFTLLKDILQIVILYVTHNYYLYLIVQIVATIASNIAISRKADAMFPEVVNRREYHIDDSEKKLVINNTVAMLSSKIGAVIVSGTDSILISRIVGLSAVGVYSNYRMVSIYLRQIMNSGINGITASVGNLVATSDDEKVYITFNRTYFINFLFSLLIAVGFWNCMSPLIIVWIGKEYLFNNLVLAVLSMNIFFNQIRQPAIITINTCGLFWKIRWKSIIEAGINLLASVLLASCFNMGVCGILLGTLISNLLTNVWWEPFVAFKYGMKARVSRYYIRLLKDTACFIGVCSVLYGCNQYIDSIILIDVWLILLLRATETILLLFVVIMAFYGRTPEMKYMTRLLKSKLKLDRS